MTIQLEEELGSGAPFAAPILVARLRSLHADPPGSHTLTSLGVTVDVRIAVGDLVGVPPDGASITLQASSESATMFPVFAGTLRVVAVDAFSSKLVLAGTYRVPLGMIGEVADRTLLAGTAKSTLQSFLADLRDEIAAAILRDMANR